MRLRAPLPAVALSVAVLLAVAAPDFTWAQPVTAEEIERFMRTAKVVRERGTDKGVTRPLRLTLSDGTYTHDALFQAIDIRMPVFVPRTGKPEMNFVDSWRYNVAAYRLARELSLDSMTSVTIEYRYNTRPGALSWWMDSLMDEATRLKTKIQPRDPRAWNNDMYRMRVFASLVHDSDRNLTNVLVSPDWRVIMVDFTRAFRLHAKVAQMEIRQCDRQLLARLEALTPESLKAAVGHYLTSDEAKAVLKRRDLLLAHVRSLVAQHGEGKVLY